MSKSDESSAQSPESSAQSLESGVRSPKPEAQSPKPLHDRWMAAAIEQARRARDAAEVPIGAVVVVDNEIVGRGFNQPISSGDPTAHAEIVAIREAARHVGNYRLTGATLYATVEPCLMCVGACVHARIGTLVYGAPEPRTGAIVSTVRGADLPGHNHRVEIVGAVREEECRALMQEFFKAKRL
jgi:tRNA(adenine34) deaminase